MMRLPIEPLAWPLHNRAERKLNELIVAFNALLEAKDAVAAEHETAIAHLLECQHFVAPQAASGGLGQPGEGQ